MLLPEGTFLPVHPGIWIEEPHVLHRINVVTSFIMSLASSINNLNELISVTRVIQTD